MGLCDMNGEEFFEELIDSLEHPYSTPLWCGRRLYASVEFGTLY